MKPRWTTHEKKALMEFLLWNPYQFDLASKVVGKSASACKNMAQRIKGDER
jgi:hypothetical protein